MKTSGIDRLKLLGLSETIMVNARAKMFYARHLKALLPWSGLGNEKQTEINEALDLMIRESAKQLAVFGAVRRRLAEGRGNVF